MVYNNSIKKTYKERTRYEKSFKFNFGFNAIW